MAEWLKVVIQGVVQGISEFLPVSSTGHLLVMSALLNFEQTNNGTFEIFIQVGTLFAVILFYRHALTEQVVNVRHDPEVQRLWFNVVIGSLPVSILGLLFLDFIESEIFPPSRAPIVIAVTLTLGGFVFLWIERRAKHDQHTVTTTSLKDITTVQAVWIGFAQALALIPGTSRSGASIVGALLVGLDRQTATAFSFYLAIPVLGGATVLQLLFNWGDLDGGELASLLGGAVISGLVAWFTIGWLLRYVSRNDFVIFGYYRIIAGVLLFILIAFGIL